MLCPFRMHRHGASQVSTKRGIQQFYGGIGCIFVLIIKQKAGWLVGMHWQCRSNGTSGTSWGLNLEPMTLPLIVGSPVADLERSLSSSVKMTCACLTYLHGRQFLLRVVEKTFRVHSLASLLPYGQHRDLLQIQIESHALWTVDKILILTAVKTAVIRNRV